MGDQWLLFGGRCGLGPDRRYRVGSERRAGDGRRCLSYGCFRGPRGCPGARASGRRRVSFSQMRKIGLTLAAFSALLIVARAAIAEEPPPTKLPADPAPCTTEAVRPIEAAVAPRLVKFSVSPFPYEGTNPVDDKPFLDYNKNGQRGHTSPRGSLHLE